jgi:prevent-host-death family protein
MFYNESMARIGVRELNQQTSQVLERVRAGEVMEITDRGVLVAELRPVGQDRSALARLIADGLVIAPTVDPAVVASLPEGPADGVNVAELLVADRAEERW